MLITSILRKKVRNSKDTRYDLFLEQLQFFSEFKNFSYAPVQ